MYGNSTDAVIEALNESVDIEGHLSFIDGLLNKYTWNNNRKDTLTGQLDLIRQKQKDTNLYLAIIGEFSSGKSTLINSLIRDDLLKIDALPATTAAATVIEHDDQMDIEVVYNDGNIMTYRKGLSFGKKLWRGIIKPKREKIKDELREYIHKATAEEEIAATIRKVTIKHPSEALKSGLVIIDTPGTDVENPRHEAVTKNAIRELSDAAIIVIPSTKPVSESIIGFLERNLKDVLARCIFIVTKMDLIRPKERERMLEFVRQRLQSAFDIQSFRVLPSTPRLVLSCFTNNPDYEISNPAEDKEILLDQSGQTEKEIYKTLREQRMLIQLQKLVVLIKTLLADLEGDLKAFEKSYEERHAALEKNKIQDLKRFVIEQKKIHDDAIRQDSIPIQLEISGLVNNAKADLLKQIEDEIFSTEKVSELKKFINKRLDVIVKTVQEGLPSKLSVLFDKLQRVGKKQVSSFETEFKKLYISLATLGGHIAVNEQKLGSEMSLMVSQSFTQQVSEVKKTARSDGGKAALTSFGIGGAGAVIGTIIFPGIGTAVGYLVGALASLLFRKSLAEQQSKYFEEIKSSVDKSFNETLESVDTSTQTVINGIITEMETIIDKYFKQYDNLVQDMIRRDELEKQELVRKSQIIKTDLSHLSNRHSSLENIREKMVRI